MQFKEAWQITLDIVSAEKGLVGFQVQPRRWVVERTFAWLSKYRRLSKDYEYDVHSKDLSIWLLFALYSNVSDY